MKTIITILLASTMLIGSTMAQAKQKVATVDMTKAFDSHQDTETSQVEIKNKQALIAKENNDKLAAIKSITDEVAKLSAQIDDPATDEGQKAALKQTRSSIVDKGEALDKNRRKWLAGKNASVNADIASKMRVIVGQIRAKVSEVAKEEGYTLVLDSSSGSTAKIPLVMFSDEGIDITDLILKKLKAAK